MDGAGQTALHCAAVRPDGLALYSLLLHHGGDPDARDGRGLSAAELAAGAGWQGVLGASLLARLERALSFALKRVAKEQPADPVEMLAKMILIFEIRHKNFNEKPINPFNI